MLRPEPHYRPLRCDFCGKEAQWRTMMYGQTYNLGIALCDDCWQKSIALLDPAPPDPEQTPQEEPA
jgi:hypothetical protein